MTFYYVIFSKFTIFTNSKQLAFKVGEQNINILRYADVIVQQSLKIVLQAIQEKLADVSKKGLSLNVSKTDCMLFSRKVQIRVICLGSKRIKDRPTILIV